MSGSPGIGAGEAAEGRRAARVEAEGMLRGPQVDALRVLRQWSVRNPSPYRGMGVASCADGMAIAGSAPDQRDPGLHRAPKIAPAVVRRCLDDLVRVRLAKLVVGGPGTYRRYRAL